jgi:SAM-dependent methyltransferase
MGDALSLPKTVGTFDVVLVANLIDRLSDPTKFLTQILPKLVNPGGRVLVTSPYTWLSEFTPPKRWLKDSFQHIKKLLRPHFRLLHRQNLPFLLREHRRKFQFTIADATLWACER